MAATAAGPRPGPGPLGRGNAPDRIVPCAWARRAARRLPAPPSMGGGDERPQALGRPPEVTTNPAPAKPRRGGAGDVAAESGSMALHPDAPRGKPAAAAAAAATAAAPRPGRDRSQTGRRRGGLQGGHACGLPHGRGLGPADETAASISSSTRPSRIADDAPGGLGHTDVVVTRRMA